MTFAYERQMQGPVAAWLRAQRLMVKREFPTPWGVCDLVGCSLNVHKVRRRLAMGQRKALRSQLRVHLLSLMPDHSERRTITLDELHRRFGGLLDRRRIEQEVERLIADRFVEDFGGHSYARRDRWMPLHKRLVAVELKLARIDDAFAQAVNNLGFADESYVALPADTARRLGRSTIRAAFREKRIGLLAVDDTVKTIIRAQPVRHPSGSVIQSYCVERFWPLHLQSIE
jgi:hypothetical protein